MGRVLTLLYHRVRYYQEDVQLLAVTPDHFREQMAWLKKNYLIVGFDENWDQTEEDAVCITFDDGYRDNFINAVPILNELQIPATIFVSTGNIDTEREMWWDELERNLLIDKEYQKRFHLSDELYECTWNTENMERRRDLYYSLHWLMKEVGIEKRNEWMWQLQRWNGYTVNGREENKALQTEDLKILKSSKIIIGAHTINHPVLSRLSREEQEKEIAGSKKYLEYICGKHVRTFSYPFGGSGDYNDEIIAICKELGFIKVAANVPGIWEKGCDQYQIPRNIVRDWDLDRFKEQIKTYWEGK